MKEYKKPLIDVVREAAEGVYATSGGNIVKCDCPPMNYNMESPKDFTSGIHTIKYALGCQGCPAYTSGASECGLLTHYEDSNHAGSYEANIGGNKPVWYPKYDADTIMTDEIYFEFH